MPSGIRRAIEYIELHFAEPLDLAELAEHAQLSRSYFATNFQRVIGDTPHRYLVKVRLARARGLLAQPKQTLSLTDIAAACGFSDQAYMSRLFRRVFRRTPAEFKRLSRQA